jgi:ribonuclease P/MRP protein subunit RPP40
MSVKLVSTRAALQKLLKLMPSSAPTPDPLAQHFPTDITSNAGKKPVLVAMPALKPSSSLISSGDKKAFEELATELYEWLSLVRLESPRIQAGDEVDSYVSRYQVPDDSDQATRSSICKISWQGFIAPSWVEKVLIESLLSVPSKAWFSISASGFSTGLIGDCTDITFVRPPNSPGEYLLWDINKRE